MHWCDICESNVKGKVIKITGIGWSIYICDKHLKYLK